MNKIQPEKPPIPLPFDVAISQQRMPGSRSYSAAATISLAAGICWWALTKQVGIGLTGVCVTTCFWMVETIRTATLLQQGARMNWHVRQADMPRMRQVIAKTATDDYVPLAFIWPFGVIVLVLGKPLWLLLLVFIAAPASLWNRHIERRFQNMPADPDVADDYAAMNIAWRHARFTIRNS